MATADREGYVETRSHTGYFLHGRGYRACYIILPSMALMPIRHVWPSCSTAIEQW